MTTAEAVRVQPAYLLHARPWRETSLQVELFSRDHGRLSAVARGWRRAKGRRSGRLLPFTPLLVSWAGRSELKNLVAVEWVGAPWLFEGRRLWVGFYVNELLLRLTALFDPHPELFADYHALLAAMAGNQAMEPVLRDYEFKFLERLGYGIRFDVDASGFNPLQERQHYRFDPERGFWPCEGDCQDQNGLFSGATLMAIAAGDYGAVVARRDARRLARLALDARLGGLPLKSRQFFQQLSGRPAVPEPR